LTLTPEQQGAVTRAGQDVCVVAGPGSGKTTVLVERYAWLISARQLRPLDILAITFTEKAAHEIKSRLAGRFQHDPAMKKEIERAPVATIHGYCARLLRRFAIAAGLDPRFEILDENRQRSELAASIRETLDGWAAHRPTDLRRVLAGWTAPDPEKALTELYDAWRTHGGTAAMLRRTPRDGGYTREQLLQAGHEVLEAAPLRQTPALATRLRAHREWLAAFTELAEDAAPFDLMAQWDFSLHGQRDERLKGKVYQFREAMKLYDAEMIERFFQPARRLLVETFTEAAALYSQKKQARGVLDFTDLETATIRLLESDASVRRRVQAEFAAILMDELQDTNPQQWRLVDLIRSPNAFFAVGDINQSIFGFRHAEPRVFAGYRDGLAQRGKAIDTLRGNNRTRHEILRLVETIFTGVTGIEAPAFDARLHHTAGGGAPVEFLRVEHDDRDRAEEWESQWIARRIRELEASGTRLRDIAILVRATTGVDVLEQALRDYQVPFVMNRGRQFFEEQEIRDLVNWLRVVDNPGDELAVLAVARSPLFGFSDDDVLRLKRAGEPLQALLRDRLRPYREGKDLRRPDELVQRLLDASGYLAALAPRARANAAKLLAMLREGHAAEPRPLTDVIASLDQLRALQVEPNAPEQQAREAVEVLTIHGSKGLEWPVVFVASLHRSAPASGPPISFSTVNGLGVQWRHPQTHKGVNDRLHERNLAERREREAEESHRLLYVAMTRAAERLILTSAGAGGRSDWPTLVEGAVEANVLTQAPPRFDLPERAAAAATTSEVRFVPVAPVETYDSNVSISRLLAFARCPRQAHLKALLPRLPGLQMPEDDQPAESPAQDFGRSVHLVLAGLAEGGAAEQQLAARFYASPLGERVARASRVEREFDFLVDVEGVVLRGQIDLWFEEDGELVVVDFKTDARPSAERLTDYRTQMRFYALAVQRLCGRPVSRCVLTFLRTGEELDVTPDHAACAALVQAWKASTHEARPGPACFTCEFAAEDCAEGAAELQRATK